MADVVNTNVQPAVRKREDIGLVEFGYVVDGAFLWFASRKLGGIEDDFARAAGRQPAGQVGDSKDERDEVAARNQKVLDQQAADAAAQQPPPPAQGEQQPQAEQQPTAEQQPPPPAQ